MGALKKKKKNRERKETKGGEGIELDDMFGVNKTQSHFFFGQTPISIQLSIPFFLINFSSTSF